MAASRQFNDLLKESTQNLLESLLKLVGELDSRRATISYNSADVNFISKMAQVITNDKKQDDLLRAFKAELFCWYFSHRFPFLSEIRNVSESAYSGLLTILGVFRQHGPVFNSDPRIIPRMMNIFKSKFNKKELIAKNLGINLYDREIQRLAVELFSDKPELIKMTTEKLRDFMPQDETPSTEQVIAQALTIVVYLVTRIPLSEQEWQAIKMAQSYPQTKTGQYRKCNRLLTLFYLFRSKSEEVSQFKSVFFSLRDYLVSLIQNAPLREISNFEFEQEEQLRIIWIPNYRETINNRPK